MKKIKVLSLVMMGLTIGLSGNLKNVNAEASEEKYDIYPTVQSISYESTRLDLNKKFNVIYEEGIDEYTKTKAIDVLSTKNIKTSITNSIVDSRTNLMLGIYGSKEVVDNYVTEDVSFINTHIDSYYLKITTDKIIVLGKDSDSVFYGLSTLDMIFEQTTSSIRSLTIKDYSASLYRGFIEGYYGIPWTSEERKELMRFGSKFKSNIYIYAPKDDAYHSSNWRGLYTENDLEILKEQIQVGLETKTRLAWAIHPFLSQAITSSNYNDSLSVIKAKFDQIYGAGVRQFVVSADDVAVETGLLKDGSLHRQLLNDLADYLKTKEGCKDLVFVPSAYCYRAETRLRVDLNQYYSTLMNGLDESIHIMWTGDDVCSSMETGRFTEFKSLTNKKPFFWLNWPVNDYLPTNLLMGKGEVLNINYEDEPAFEGIVTNPMQQAEPSKLSIVAICDYAWNPREFDMDKSYEASFKYIEETAYDSFKFISSHLTNANLYEGKYFEESESLALLINNLEQAKINNANVTARYQYLIEYFEALVSKSDYFINNASNRKLVESMLPWVEALKDAGNAMINYLSILKDFDSYSNEELKTMLEKANDYEEASKLHKEPVLNVITYNVDYKYADFGVKVLKPFMQKIKQSANDEVKIKLGLPTGIVYEGFDSIYSGTLDNIIDGDESTYCWFGSNPAKDAYVRIDLEEVKDIHDIKVLFGNANGPTDYMVGNVYTSLDAKNYTLAGSLKGAETLLDLRDNPVKARFIMLKNTDTQTWVSIKEVAYNTLAKDEPTVTFDGFPNGFGNAAHSDLNLMLDNDLSTYVWFDWKCKAGAYVLLDMRKVKDVNKIKLYQNSSEHPGDLFKNCSIYVSEDGTNYTRVGEGNYLSQDEIVIDLTNQNVKARYVKIVSNIENVAGICIRELVIE